jgi:signal transduction histidine kinase
MRVSIKAKQVAGVTAIVGFAVVLLSGWYLSSLAGVRLDESQARADLLVKIIYQRAREVVATGQDPATALGADAGLRAILQSSAYANNATYAAIVDVNGIVIAHSDELMVGKPLPWAGDLAALVTQGPIAQARAVYVEGGRTFEQRLPLFVDQTEIGSIRVGVSTLLVRDALSRLMRRALYTAFGAILGASVVAMLLAQIVLRPIHVIRSGLARLGRGEVDVNVDLPQDSELTELGDSFKAVSARLAADRTQLAGQRATLESVVEHLEDAVALFALDGTLLFANPVMRTSLGEAKGTLSGLLAADHPYRALVEESIATREPRGPQAVQAPEAGERLVLTHVVEDADHRPLGIMLVARNLTYLSQVESTLSYSRKLAALGRLSAGIAHEVKNPLNATMIHLELLKMELADAPAAAEHVSVIATQMRRLDEVVQGFLKFTRPEDLKLQPVLLAPLVEELMPIIRAEAEQGAIDVRIEVPADLPPVSADPAMLQQALLNLALNACQAMPHGGRLRIGAAARAAGRIEVVVEDTGVGIQPEHLARIFDLYYTTKEQGSGIGLSMVYRTVQLHDADIEVQSVPGRGTTFRVILQQA